MVRNGIVWIHCCRSLKRPQSQQRFALLLQYLAHQNVGSCGCCIEPYRSLEEAFGFVELLEARVGVRQLVVGRSVSRIQLQFLLKIRYRLRHSRLIEMKLSQEEVRKRKSWNQRDCFRRILLGDWIVFLSKQHTRGEQIRCSGIFRHTEHLSESGARRIILLGLDVADAEDIGTIYVGLGKPRLYLFQQGDSLLGTPKEIIGNSQQLSRFVVSWIFFQRLREEFRRVFKIALLVIEHAEFVGKAGRLRCLSLQRAQRSECGIEFALLLKMPL